MSGRAGYVLAGGRSSRMGRDKARLPFRGSVLAETIAREVERAAGSAVIVGAHGAAAGYPAIPDLYPGEGPLGGILTALCHTESEWNLVVACDMPEITAEFLTRLLDGAERAQTGALVPRSPSGVPEPLCAVYRRNSRDAIDAAFRRGVRKVTQALAGVPTVSLDVAEEIHFQNVNTPEDWAPYAAD